MLRNAGSRPIRIVSWPGAGANTLSSGGAVARAAGTSDRVPARTLDAVNKGQLGATQVGAAPRTEPLGFGYGVAACWTEHRTSPLNHRCLLGLESNKDRTALQIIGTGRLFVGQGDGLQVFKIRA